MRPRLLLPLGLLLTLAVFPGCQPPLQESNEIEVWIDGELQHRWTVPELMKGRFDWESPKGQIYPAVPISFLIGPGPSELSPPKIESLRVIGRNGQVEMDGSELPPLEDLLLKLDIARGGSWQLVLREGSAREAFGEAGKEWRLRRVSRLEIAVGREES